LRASSSASCCSCLPHADSELIGLALAALFIALNGFFVAAEFALVKVRATQLSPRAKRGERSAIVAQQIGARLDRYLSTTQLGITLASLGLGWIGEPALAEKLHGPFSHLPIPPRTLEIATVAVALGFLTFAHVLLGELVPKLVAIQRTEQTALFSAVPLRIVYLTFQPFLFVLERASRLVLRVMGLEADVTSEGTLSEEEIIGILAANTTRSPRARDKSELVERVLRFSQRTARHVMVPRVDIAYVSIRITVAEAIEQFRQHGYSRLLVTKERSLDDVAGYLYVKDLLDRDAAQAPDLKSLTRDVLFVPEGQNLVEIMRDMQRKGVLIAVVVDEYGGTSGLVTMEDLLEEIVGEIRDELDEEPPHIVKKADGWEVDGRASMEEVAKAAGVALDDGAEQVGIVVLKRIARLPRVGDRVDLGGGLSADVISLHRRRITKLKLTRKNE
jgi:CBS domain containing-hemolysin-like protein